MLIYAYVDEYYKLHIDPTVTINSENENDYQVKFIFQQPEGWGKDFSLYGVFKPVNDIPVSFKCDENNIVTVPNLYYGRYKRLGIALRGVAYSQGNLEQTSTSSVEFTKDSFTKMNDNEYVCTISKSTLLLSSPNLLNICVYTDNDQTILEPVDYFVKYTTDDIIIILNIPLDTYSSYNGRFNFIQVSGFSNSANKKIVRSTDYFYVPVVMGAMQ